METGSPTLQMVIPSYVKIAEGLPPAITPSGPSFSASYPYIQGVFSLVMIIKDRAR